MCKRTRILGWQSIVMSMSVCLCVFVCPRSYLQNCTSALHQIVCASYLWPWLGPPLAVLRYIMYFRVMDNVIFPDNVWAYIATQKGQALKVAAQVVALGAQSAVYDVCFFCSSSSSHCDGDTSSVPVVQRLSWSQVSGITHPLHTQARDAIGHFTSLYFDKVSLHSAVFVTLSPSGVRLIAVSLSVCLYVTFSQFTQASLLASNLT